MSEEVSTPVEAAPEVAPVQEAPAQQTGGTILGDTPSAAATAPETPEAGAAWVEGGKFTQAFYDQLGSEEVRPIVEKYQGDPAKMVKALNESQRFIGKRLAVPGEDASPDVLAKFREVNAIPDNPHGYNIQKPAELPEGVEFDVDSVNSEWAPLFHKLNLTPAQVNALVAKEVEMQGKLARSYRSQSEAHDAQYVASQKKELEEAFGDSYTERIADAQRFAKTIGIDLNDPSVGNNAKFIRALAKGATLVSPDKMVPPAEVQTAQSVKAQATDIMTNPANPDHLLYKGQFGTYAQQQEVRQRVRAMLGGNGG